MPRHMLCDAPVIQRNFCKSVAVAGYLPRPPPFGQLTLVHWPVERGIIIALILPGIARANGANVRNNAKRNILGHKVGSWNLTQPVMPSRGRCSCTRNHYGFLSASCLATSTRENTFHRSFQSDGTFKFSPFVCLAEKTPPLQESMS